MSLQVLQMQSCVCVWQCVAVWFQMCATPGLINGSFLISLREILHQRPLTWFLSRPSLSVIHTDLSESVQQSRQKSVTNVSLLCFPNNVCVVKEARMRGSPKQVVQQGYVTAQKTWQWRKTLLSSHTLWDLNSVPGAAAWQCAGVAGSHH